MPRKTRQFMPGVPCHVIQRGNNRQSCFIERSDYRDYLRWLGVFVGRHGVAIHAYVLMTNHVHLLLSPSTEQAIPKMMQSLGRCYVRRFNDRHERSGTLWEGRYRSESVLGEAHVLACYRYIELNPVRAGMVEEPDDYPWSSYASNRNGLDDSLITPHACWRGLGFSDALRREAYVWVVSSYGSEA